MPVLRVLPLPPTPGRIHCAVGCQVGRSSRSSCKGSVWQPPWILGFLESRARGVSADLAIRPCCCSRARWPQHSCTRCTHFWDRPCGQVFLTPVHHTCSCSSVGGLARPLPTGPASPVSRSPVPPGSGVSSGPSRPVTLPWADPRHTRRPLQMAPCRSRPVLSTARWCRED